MQKLQKKQQKGIAKERIKRLFSQAEKIFRTQPAYSHRYVSLARKIAIRYNIRLNPYKREFCRKCLRYLVPSENCKVRTRNSQQCVIITCTGCGNVMRHPYRRKK